MTIHWYDSGKLTATISHLRPLTAYADDFNTIQEQQELRKLDTIDALIDDLKEEKDIIEKKYGSI